LIWYHHVFNALLAELMCVLLFAPTFECLSPRPEHWGINTSAKGTIMSLLTYTKKCIVEFSTVEGLIAHSNHVGYGDWHNDQIASNLGDANNSFLPFKCTGPTTSEILCVNQSQAEELIAMMVNVGEQLNHPLTASTILDFSDTIQSFKQDLSKVVAIDYHTLEDAGKFFYETEPKSLAWYYDEIVNYQADPNRTWVQYGYISPTVCLVRVKDIQQAERFVAFEQQLAEEFNYTVACTISDYSSTQIDFNELNLFPNEF
jgi:hypothetical protein